MPNHFHGIIVIGENEYNKGEGNGDGCDGDDNGDGRDAINRVSTNATHCVPTNSFAPQSKNLASSKKDIGWYGLIVVYTIIGMLIYLILGQFKKI